LVLAAAAVISRSDPFLPAADELVPYTETIPGTNLKFEMVPLPGGKFIMGSPATEKGRGADEGPQVEVEIAPFWMGKFEVTWDEYDVFGFQQDLKKKRQMKVDLAAQPANEKAADAVTRPTPPYADETFGYAREGHPVISITHHAAMEYCAWLSAKTGKTYRLPTEAEWEYAARAGTKTAYSFGADPKLLGDYAWFAGNSQTKPHPVGKKKPNPWGLHDMHGNVAEWVLDRYRKSFYATLKKGAISPVLLPGEEEYPNPVRGGSWDDPPERLRSAARRASSKEWNRRDPQEPQSIWWLTEATNVGFRVVRPLKEQEQLVGFRSQTKKGFGPAKEM
jgi:formylglycine-generating enzyme required for sulfatase activity